MPNETPKRPDWYKTWLDYWVEIPLTPKPYIPYLQSVRDFARAELAALRERVNDLECDARLRRELDWTGTICDALNSLVRENAALFTECTDGPSAAELVGSIHGKFNNLRRLVRSLESQLAHLVSDAGPDSCAEQLMKARNAALDEAAKVVQGWHIRKGGYGNLSEEILSLKGGNGTTG